MKTILVDDERLARQELRKLLNEIPEISIVAECSDPNDAIKQINESKPDLVFLDIQMPGKNGFELLKELNYTPKIIFVSAFDDYAIRAFEVNALDYLLKPVMLQRLKDAVARVSDDHDKVPEESTITTSLSEDDQVFVKDGERCWFVKLADVRLFESEGNYVRVYFGTNRPLILRSLNNLDERLNPKSFFRASRKHIINLKWIEGIENWFNGGLMVKLKGGEQIEISRRQSTRFKEMMSL